MRGPAAFALAASLVAGCAQSGSDEVASDDDAGRGSVTDNGPDATSAPGIVLDASPGLDNPATVDAAADVVADAAPTSLPQSLVGVDVPDARVGILYSVWHAPASTVQRRLAADGGAALTMEDVLRSNGALAYADIYPNGVASAADGFYYMAKPSLGFYCIYRARPNETGYVADCPDISTTLSTHAAELIAAGVDHVVVDDSNLTGTDEQSDLLQIRPTEVLFEEWAALRATGVKTPQIAVWNPVPTGATQWQSLLGLYQNADYDGLLLHDKATGKKVFFLVDPGGSSSPDASIVAQIEANGGRNDVEVQRMWTLGSTDPTLDKWAFMSFCQSAAGGATTTILGLAACDQPYSPASTLGSAVAVSPSFQTGYGSLPWGAPGKLGGYTLRQEWATALRVMPKTVFVSSWNELIAQPQANPFTNDPYARSVGLERDPGGANLFVDTFGAELSRDLEPNVVRGTADYDLLASCVRVFRANAANGTTGCAMSHESCCATTSGAAYTNVYALRDDASADSVLTTSTTESASLVVGGYRAVCARYGTPSAFCVDGNEPSTPFGPFLAFTAASAGRNALYRCLTGGHHFVSLDAKCEGQTVEGVLAYAATAPSSEMPRRLERCYFASTGEHIEALGFACPSGATDESTLGFVR